MVPDFSNEFGTAEIFQDSTYKLKYSYPWGGVLDVQREGPNCSYVGSRSRPFHEKSGFDKSINWREPNRYVRQIIRVFPSPDDMVFHFVPHVRDNDNRTDISKVFSNYQPIDIRNYSDTKLFGSYWAGGAFDSNIYNKAIVAAMNKFSDGGASVGENLAQARKSIDEIATVGGDIAALWNGFRRHDYASIISRFTHHGDVVKALSERWLSYQYGWKPLAQDLYSLVKQFGEAPQGGALLCGSGKSKDTTEQMDDDVEITTNVFIKVKLYGNVWSAFAHSLARNGLLNPLELAWELLPYSFIVDWVAPVGPMLQAYTDAAGLDWKGGTVSATVAAKGVVKHLYNNYESAEWERLTSGPLRVPIQAIDFRRRVLGGFPTPIPYFKNPFSSAHLLNAAALIGGMKR